MQYLASMKCRGALCKLAVATAAAAAASFGLAAGAGGHQRTFASDLQIQGWNASQGSSVDYAYGKVYSSKPCTGGRTVKIFRLIDGKYRLIDQTKTSRRGFWAGGGDPQIGQGGKVTVTRSRVGPRSHQHICGADTELFD